MKDSMKDSINNNTSSQNKSLLPFLSILVLFTVLSLLNYPIIETLERHSFDDGTYSHAFLIPFIVLYLFFELSRSGKLLFREKLSTFSILLVISSAFLLFITSNAQISIGYWLAILALATSSLILLFNFSWIIIFPVVFLAFIFPFWGLLTPLLQNLSVVAVTYIMSFTGIPTFVEAEFVTIPAGVFEIADGCSGLRYFIVSIAISSLYVFLYIKSLKRAALFITVAIIGALVTNWIRITALIMIGEYTNMESSLMEDHNTFGWYIYIPFMVLLFAWGNRLIDTDIFQNNNKTTFATKPKFIVVLVLLAIIIVSSTTIKSFLNNTQNNKTTNTMQMTGISPTVYFYSSVDQKTLDNNGSSYKTFNFDGSNLDGKPSYYANEMMPKDHLLIRAEITKGWNINYTKSHQSTAIILFKYELDEVTYTSLGSLKIARIKKALTNINDTKLHWVYLACESDCNNALNNFIETHN